MSSRLFSAQSRAANAFFRDTFPEKRPPVTLYYRYFGNAGSFTINVPGRVRNYQ